MTKVWKAPRARRHLRVQTAHIIEIIPQSLLDLQSSCGSTPQLSGRPKSVVLCVCPFCSRMNE
eukprot:3331414-Amphidinium_carterae.1